MNHFFRRAYWQFALATPLLATAAASQAGSIDLTPNQIGFLNGAPVGLVSGSYQTLSLSEGMMSFMDITRTEMPPPATFTKDADGYYTSANSQAEVTSAQLDTETRSIQSITDASNVTFVAPQSLLGKGGTLRISNLTVDYTTRQVFGDVSGSGLASPLAHLHLWSASTLTSSITGNGIGGGGVDFLPLTNYTVTLSGLTLTQAGLDLFAQNLNLYSLAKGALNVYNQESFGKLTTQLTLAGHPATYAAPVPEPSTWAPMALGLIGVGAAGAARRRRQG